MATLNLVIAAASRLKDNLKPFSIVNPVPGQSGIYQIKDDAGGTFNAYVDMATDGGYWILTTRWAAALPAQNVIPMVNQIVKDAPLAGFSATPDLYPAVPAGRIAKNPSKEFLFQSENAGWKSLYGDYQRGQLLAAGTTSLSTTTSIPVTTPLGNKLFWGVRAGWRLETDLTALPLGFWTINNNNGPCGGENQAGSNRMCPLATTGSAYTQHCDFTSLKRFYLRAVNYPG